MTVEIPEDAWLTTPETPITTDEIRSGLQYFRHASEPSLGTSVSVQIDADVTDVIDDAVTADVSDDALAAAARAVTEFVESMSEDRSAWDWDDLHDDPKHTRRITLTLTDSDAAELVESVRVGLVAADDPALVDATGDAINATAYVVTYAALRATTGSREGLHQAEAVVNRSEERREARRDERRERYSGAAEARRRAENAPEPEDDEVTAEEVYIK